MLQNFGLTFFDRFKTGTYLVNWFGRGSADQTWRFGGSAKPCRTSKFGRYRCRCRFIGRSLQKSMIFWVFWNFEKILTLLNWWSFPQQLSNDVSESQKVRKLISIRNVFRLSLLCPILVRFSEKKWHLGAKIQSWII